MRLYIAEKPSVGRAIAEALGVTGKGDGYLECAGATVTWCFGHMLEQAEPDAYTPDTVPRGASGKKVWRTDELPIIPDRWILQAKDDAKQQLATIGRLLKRAGEVVHAGDPDREGQLLVDVILGHFGYQGAVLRYWVSAVDAVSVKRGLAALTPNAQWAPYGQAAQGRREADWLIGMNLSRAYTLRAQRGGSTALLTVGRVQTPTLALVVDRDRAIEAFTPRAYHTLRATFQHPAGLFTATWQAGAEQAGLDEEGRLVDTAVADALVARLAGQAGAISQYKQAAKSQAHPLAYALSDITALASSIHGYSAEQVLAACQALYENYKLTSYPRTDCAYLPESQHADAPAVLAAVRDVDPGLAGFVDGADPRIKSRTWDDSKVTAHHGIIPTMHHGRADALPEVERNIYRLVAVAYLAQFYQVHEFMHTQVDATVAGELFTVSGRVTTRAGWRAVYQLRELGEPEEGEEQSLPAMAQGDAVEAVTVERRDAKTKAPARFTEGTLIRAMENIHRYVEAPEHKKMLRDGDGIGTPATRAAIIGDLKRREYLAPKGKQIASTPLGRSLIDALPDSVKSPILTALYERMLKGVEEGRAELEAFRQRQVAFIRDQVAKANKGAVRIEGGKAALPVSTVYKCSACGHGLIRRPGRRPGLFWWSCSHYPHCTQSYPDLKGRPDYTKGRTRPANATPTTTTEE